MDCDILRDIETINGAMLHLVRTLEQENKMKTIKDAELLCKVKNLLFNGIRDVAGIDNREDRERRGQEVIEQVKKLIEPKELS